MGNTDSTPGISQLKSLVQVTVGDAAGARTTQENFAYRNTFPVLSQISSAGHAKAGDMEAAANLQIKFAEDLESEIKSIPVVGHVIGGIHFALGETKKGEDSVKAASRSTGVLIGATSGFLAAGPVGGALGALNGGAAVDSIITGSEFLAKGEDAERYGYGAIVYTLKHHGDEVSSFDAVDMAAFTVSDVISGGFIAKKPKKIV